MDEAAQSDVPEHRPPTPPIAAPYIAQGLEQTQIAKYHTKGGHGFAAEPEGAGMDG